MRNLDPDDYERTCRRWASDRPQERRRWRELWDALSDRDGWSFLAGGDDAQRIGWYVGSASAPRLLVTAEGDELCVHEPGEERRHRFASTTELMRWVAAND